MSRFEKVNNHKFGTNVLGSIWKELPKSVEFKETVVMKDPEPACSQASESFPSIDKVLGITQQEYEIKYNESTMGSNPSIPEKKTDPEEFDDKFKKEIKRLSLKDVAKKIVKDKKFSLNFD